MIAIRIIALFLFLCVVIATGLVMAVATGFIGMAMFLAALPLCFALMVRLARLNSIF